MEKQALFRDRQELQNADLNNVQTWGDEAHAHLVTDAITPEILQAAAKRYFRRNNYVQLVQYPKK